MKTLVKGFMWTLHSVVYHVVIKRFSMNAIQGWCRDVKQKKTKKVKKSEGESTKMSHWENSCRADYVEHPWRKSTTYNQ